MPAPKPLILVVTSTLPRWAADTEPRFVLDLCEALAERYRIRILAPHCAGAAAAERWGPIEIRRFRYGPAWAERLAYDGGMLPRLRRAPGWWLLVPLFFAAQTLAVLRELRREPPALVHAHWLVPQGLSVRVAQVLARDRTPLVCTAHGADVFGLRSAPARALQRWVARGCARIGAVSVALLEELVRRGVPRERLRVLPMGVALPPPAAGPREPELIAFAGRLVEKKGVDVLLDAFQQLARARPRAALCIAGGGPEAARYRARATALGVDGRVQFLGPVPQREIQRLFGRAAVAVMPSATARDGDSEGLGLVMLEAMAAGCPVVATDLPAVRDVVTPGETGLTFRERDAAALAEAFERLLADPALAGRLAAAGRRLVEGRYAWPVVAARYDAAFAEAQAAR